MTAIRKLCPVPTRCHQCGAIDAVSTCPKCGTERPAFAALKNITAKQRAQVGGMPPCRYFPGSLCGCGEFGACLEAV